MTKLYAESETQAPRRNEGDERVRLDTDGGENAGQFSTGIGSQRFQLDRENSSAGNLFSHAIGGMLDQLIDDAEKQLVKSRECIVWYREEEKEYEQKLNNFRRLKELHLRQISAAGEQPESSNDRNGGEDLAK